MAEPKSIDVFDCPTRRSRSTVCKCKPVCRRCHLGPHVSLHGPLLDEPMGSRPYDHEYAPEEEPSDG